MIQSSTFSNWQHSIEVESHFYVTDIPLRWSGYKCAGPRRRPFTVNNICANDFDRFVARISKRHRDKVCTKIRSSRGYQTLVKLNGAIYKGFKSVRVASLPCAETVQLREDNVEAACRRNSRHVSLDET
jgi:hypothetical protein